VVAAIEPTPSSDRLGDAGFATLARRLEAIAARRDPIADRLRYAGTSVAFRLDGDPGECLTLLLDRAPIAVVRGPEPAEVQVTFTAGQVRRFAAGALPLTEAILSGAVRTHGPVRRYLEIDPILRGLLAPAPGPTPLPEAAADHHTVDGPVDPDLLAIETRGLHKRFGSHRVLNGLDLTIPEGVISAVLGPSGTGKSVLLQHVIGVMRPDAGDVLIRGRALGRMSRSEILSLRREIGVMFQDGALFSAMSVYENVAFPLRQHTDADESEVRDVVEHHLRSVGLGDAAHRMPGELSGGMRKRAGLARALVLNPGIVLCDEPDSGLDPVRTALLGDLLVEQHAQYGGTMVVVTHNVMLARRIADHMSVIWRGEVLESGMARDVLASESRFVQQFLSGEAEGPLGMDA
jgi:phospholipid/cholesterol/gamma-HCH transport system ATP-binding protein